ncbi:hypothetical protein, unknown function [Leishmania mexicana MHOM/GT/2001/U1103]|uniref:Uncharacterized protein n=1 Tax=Leishmania mexicana (strain MHOM/GT/2001/U1103) TaxID=929439 RepID=E9B1G1_LEIMU|nr:hypothetical protein, unknown function [Leishmania mexicana MHOM/GT/2001/U1103]CBZ29067.1 hypothetical protein, unknown function [Leishmania mexicana MHOM/GT/2001/U1103]
MSKAAVRIKRFDEVDSDSDFEFRDESLSVKAMPTVSFKTATATNDSDSISFQSDHDHSQHLENVAAPATIRQEELPIPTVHPTKSLASALKQASSVAAAKRTPPASPTPVSVLNAKPGATEQPPLQQHSSAPPASVPEHKRSAAAPAAALAVPAASTPIERPSYASLPSQPTPLAKPTEDSVPSPSVIPFCVTAHASPVDPARSHDDDNEDQASDEFVQHVLPLPPRQAAARQPPPTSSTSQVWANGTNGIADASRLRPCAADNATEELLVRAQLRLEERRRMGMASQRGSRQLSPWRSAAPSLVNTLFHERLPQPSVNHISPTRSVDLRIRRLQQENARLQDEVAFLGRENQKLRGVQRSADASEAVRLQLTVDMLRKELESKQLGFQRTLDAAFAELKEAQRQIEEAAEQCEGYQSAADQYKQLYSDKQKEMEKVKTQLQSLLYDVNAMEQHQRSMESECANKVASEREKAERAVALAEEVKRQRDHLQFLNTQLRNEVSAAVEAKRQAVDQATGTKETARRDRADHEQRIQQLNEDVAQLRKALADKGRAHEVQLREAQQAQAVLQDRLKDQAEDQQREAERNRRTLEATKEDHKRALQQERMRRVEVEERLRRMEEEGRSTQSRYTASLSAEAESRVRKLRDEMQAERLAREAAEHEAARLATEVEQLRDSVTYYQQESQRMSTNLAQSEQLREKTEQQCASLTHTLEDMMAQEEAHAREIEQLQEAIRTGAQWGSGVAAGRGPDTDGIVSDLQQLSDENERLTRECTRLADERNTLIDENGRIAEELLKWKHEMRQYVASHLRTTSSQRGPLNSVPAS